MEILFYISSVVAIVATALVITRKQAVHALLYLILSLLAVAVIFFLLGAHFAAALEVIIYAGAIMVLFIFIIIMLNIGSEARMEKRLLNPSVWAAPAALSAVLLAVFLIALARMPGLATWTDVGPRQVGTALFGPYLIGVELASILLLAGLVGAFHLGRHLKK